MEILSFKIGGFSIYLGVMLFLNMYLFFRGRKKAKQKSKVIDGLTKPKNPQTQL